MHTAVLPYEFKYIYHILVVVVQGDWIGLTDKFLAEEEIDFIYQKNPTGLSL